MLGCLVDMLLAGSPKPGNRIAPAAGPRLGGVRPAGSPLGDPGPLLFPANSFEIAQAWGEFASLFQRGSLSYTQLARPHKVPELALVGYLQMARSPWGRRPGGGFLLLPNNDKPPQQVKSLLSTSLSHPVLPPAYTLTPTIGVPQTAAPGCRGTTGRNPGPKCVCLLRFRRLQGSFLQYNPISVCSVRI